MRHDLTPHRIADETYLVPGRLDGRGDSPYAVQLNSMVIRGRQPVIVDTGAPINRDHHEHSSCAPSYPPIGLTRPPSSTRSAG